MIKTRNNECMFAGVKKTNKKALKFCGKDRWLKIENMFVDFRKIERGAPLPEIHRVQSCGERTHFRHSSQKGAVDSPTPQVSKIKKNCEHGSYHSQETVVYR